LGETASALGLYKYGCNQPPIGFFGGFCSTILHHFQAWRIAPTYIGAEGPAYSGKLIKFGSRTHDKLVKSHFADVTGLSIVANEPGSDAPAYDSFASASLSCVSENRELLACIVVNEVYVQLRSPEYGDLLRSLVTLCGWSFGYGFSSSVEKQPELHLLGLDNGKLTADEYKSLCSWYAASGGLRTALLRDVYPYNLLNDLQLEAQVAEGVTLRQFAGRQEGCSLTRLADCDLCLWDVPDAEIPHVKNKLRGSPVLMG